MGDVIYMPLEINPNVFLHPKEFERVGKNSLYLAACSGVIFNENLSVEANILMEHFLAMLAGRSLCVGIMSLACALSCLMGNALAATSDYDTQLGDGMVLVISKMQRGTANAEENLS